jgi:putative toxin-antitoxin system antitoxin component (TIGR02293 family)
MAPRNRWKTVALPHSVAPTCGPPEELVYARIGTLLDLKPVVRGEFDLIDCLERGLPAAAVAALRARAGLSDEEVFKLIAPRRTLSRRQALGQPLAREEADRVVRIARIAARAMQALGGKADIVADWLRRPKKALRGRTPMQALATEAGALLVEDLLIGIEHGMFA